MQKMQYHTRSLVNQHIVSFFVKYTVLFQEILFLILKTLDIESSGCVRKFLFACVRKLKCHPSISKALFLQVCLQYR